MTLGHALERSVLIRASRSTVFRHFTDPARFAAWWGEGSTVEPRPGGRVLIRYPNAVEASGEVLEIVEGERFVFSYGYASGEPIPPGASRVTLTLHEVPGGVRVDLRHEFAEAAVRDQHRGGWAYQLAVFANVACALEYADLAAIVDRYFAAWAETDAARRRAELERIVTADVTFRDQHGCRQGLDELNAQVTAVQAFVRAARIERTGEVRQCQGMALVDWRAYGAQESELGHGTNVLELAPGGRIASVVGFWAR